MTRPIGISKYELIRALPRELASSLPAIEEIEAEFDKSSNEGASGSQQLQRRVSFRLSSCVTFPADSAHTGIARRNVHVETL